MDTDFHARLAPYLEAFDGSFAFYAQRLDDGATLEHDADAPMPPASAIKLAIMAAVYRCAEVRAIDLSQPAELPAGTTAPGSGVLRYLRDGASLTLRDHVRLMIAASDNLSTALVLRTMGLDVMHSELAGLGLKRTRLIVPARPDEGPRGQGISTARELGTLLEGIARRTLATPAACEAMAAHLDCQLYGDQIARLLPHNLYAGDRDIGARLRVANKTGFSRGVRADAGIVSIDGTAAFAVVTLAADHPDHGYYPDHPANIMNAVAARLALAHWLGEDGLAALATRHAPLPRLPGAHAVARVW